MSLPSSPGLGDDPTRVASEEVTTSAVAQAAELLREELLTGDQLEVFLGSVDDLAQRMAMNRQTIRQALRILESEELVEMVRGRRGGFYGRPPSTAVVARVVSAYLRVHGVSPGDLFETSGLVLEEAVRLAATNASAEDKRRLVLISATPLETADPAEALDVAFTVGKLLGELSGRPILALLIDVLMHVGTRMDQRNVFEDRKVRRAQERSHKAVASAVEAGDAAGAVAAQHELAKMHARLVKREL